MRFIYKEEQLVIPDDVEVNISKRCVTVKGPRGVLERDFGFVTMEINTREDGKLELIMWHKTKTQAANLRTIRTIVNNMFIGVTKGFQYKMRYVYAHFPINVQIIENGTIVEIRNYLGQKHVRNIPILEGVSARVSTDQKDELIIEGNGLESVSQTAASIQQSCKARNKDIRKFLDGIYVSERTTIVKDE